MNRVGSHLLIRIPQMRPCAPIRWSYRIFIGALTIGWSLVRWNTQAQNLVPNPGFETYSALPSTYAQICLATGWSSANGSCVLQVGCGSPEYYHTAATGGVKPPNTYWATVMPHTGNGLAGFAPWYLSSPTFREYVRTTLTAPMVIGQTYEVGFWITNAVSTIHPYGINHFGVAFSTSPLVQSCGAQIVCTPQLEYSGVLYSSGWQYVSMLFTPTVAYQYMCIGDFVPFANTTYQSFGGPGNSGAYYYLDDIAVQPATSLPVDLLSFTVRAEERDAIAEWTTATEIDNDHFDVLRSTDGSEWTLIATVPGAGNSQAARSYQALDPYPPIGTDYYRLSQVDMDGSAHLSSVASVRFDNDGHVRIWPQPNNGTFTMNIGNDVPVRVVDGLGRSVGYRTWTIGTSETGFALDQPSSGPYFIYTTDGTFRARMMVQ